MFSPSAQMRLRAIKMRVMSFVLWPLEQHALRQIKTLATADPLGFSEDYCLRLQEPIWAFARKGRERKEYCLERPSQSGKPCRQTCKWAERISRNRQRAH